MMFLSTAVVLFVLASAAFGLGKFSTTVFCLVAIGYLTFFICIGQFKRLR